MLDWIKVKMSAAWAAIRKFFKDSEVIFWARLQVVLGVLLAVVPTLDPVSWLDTSLTSSQRWTMAGWAIASGIATEVLRRLRATDLE